MLITKRAVLRSMLAAGVLAGAGFASAPANAQEVIRIGTPLALTGGLAEEGKTGEAIARYYYTGSEIKKWY